MWAVLGEVLQTFRIKNVPVASIFRKKSLCSSTQQVHIILCLHIWWSRLRTHSMESFRFLYWWRHSAHPIEQSSEAAVFLITQPRSMVRHSRGTLELRDGWAVPVFQLSAYPPWDKKIVNLIAKLLEAVPRTANPYIELHRHLLATHQQMDIQGVEQLHQMPPVPRGLFMTALQ